MKISSNFGEKIVTIFLNGSWLEIPFKYVPTLMEVFTEVQDFNEMVSQQESEIG